MGQKRGRDSKAQALQSKKRKAAKAEADSVDNAWDGIVGIDELNWQEVALPDRMEDVGGFFGLEEIDGVDIVRPQGNGQVQFKAKSGKSKNSILKAPSESEGENGEEWSGFSDEDSNKKPTTPNGAAKKTKEDKKSKNKKGASDSQKDAKPKESKHKESKPPQDPNLKASLSFAALEDAEEDDSVDVSAWDRLGLSPEILTALSKKKFGEPTPVQKACIPAILDGRDVLGKAKTGSGKTLAFGIPILEHYLEKRGKKADDSEKKDKSPIALIMSPTRELAQQLQGHIDELITNAPDIDARTVLLTGGLNSEGQKRKLGLSAQKPRAIPDIFIGTPGRVWEFLRTESGLIRKMRQIKFLVIDEVDMMLKDGHFKEVEDILAALDRPEYTDVPDTDEVTEEKGELETRQTLVFSATFNIELQQKLAGKGRRPAGEKMDQKQSMEYLRKKLNFRDEKPRLIDVNPNQQMAEGIKEGIVECHAMEKDLYLYSLLLYYPKHRTLVFTNSISAARRLTQLLQSLQLPALALHSSMAQKARLRSLERFSSPSSDPSSILVATDVAARGLDIKGIDCVIHYHAPRTADTYVHRSGRTARAGAVGKSVIICSPDEVVSVARLAAKVHVQKSNANTPTKKLPLESLDIDRTVVSRLRPRITLAKRITDSTIAKQKVSAEDNWLRAAADDLGVEYDSDEFNDAKGKQRGRGGGREQREKQASSITKGEMAGLRAELKNLLSQRVNTGVQERYLTAGRVDIEALIRGEGNEAFLGHLQPLTF
ncbi:ATP-dependent RNA helicase mak5 [Penicillium hispanicum]|uniref:ATP-dependent RNA helicase mak5 n=1 Tax=Penicillium hispanicum TaxID=1080232 RepID=UPI002541C51F|nr:ATP-dependent RNA helicase mak5 [Penicillium hispanicum]KAJ5594987.1 ATP-dependent RNA helicase mak5 [Penicillium hispanicum]